MGTFGGKISTVHDICLYTMIILCCFCFVFFNALPQDPTPAKVSNSHASPFPSLIGIIAAHSLLNITSLATLSNIEDEREGGGMKGWDQ